MSRIRAALGCACLGGLVGWVYPLWFGHAQLTTRRIFAGEYAMVGASLGFFVANYLAMRRHLIDQAWKRHRSREHRLDQLEREGHSG